MRKFGFLSGGIDSSIIAYELNKNLNISSFTNPMDPNEIIDRRS